MRVEGVYWAILVIPLAVFAHRSSSPREWRPMIIYAALVGIGYAVYFAVRYSYYQLPFSNSTYVKMGLSGHTLGRGFDYLAVQFLAMLTPFLMFPGAVVALRRGRRSVGIPIVVVTFGMVAFTAVASGDFMAFGRLLVPGLAFNAILFAWLLQDLGGAAKGMRFAAGAIGLGIVAIGVLPAGEINVVPRSVRASFHFRLNSGDLFRSELEQWRFEKDNAREWGEIGRALADYADPGEALVAGAIGAIGYYSNLFIYDGFGLVTRKVSARDVTGPIVKSPGHDKAVPPTFFLEDRPIYLSVSMVAADSPAQAAEEIRIRAAGFRRGGPHRQYVPDYLPLGDGATDERIRYVFILKRIPDGVDPDDAWGEFAARLRRFAADPE